MQYLYKLHEVADNNRDPQMADFVEVMLEEQVRMLTKTLHYTQSLDIWTCGKHEMYACS